MGQIPVPLKPTLIVPGEAARCKEEMTITRKPYIVIVWPGCLVTQASHAWFAYVLSGPQTDTSRDWSLCSHCAGNDRTVSPFCLQYSNASLDKCESWLSDKRTIGLSFEGLACVLKCFRYLMKWSSVIYPDGWTMCEICWLYPVFNDSVGEVLFTPVWHTLLQYIAEIRKGIWNPSPRFSLTLHVFRSSHIS